jgi:hypothetical protein
MRQFRLFTANCVSPSNGEKVATPNSRLFQHFIKINYSNTSLNQINSFDQVSKIKNICNYGEIIDCLGSDEIIPMVT